jgi:hypothetical protein
VMDMNNVIRRMCPLRAIHFPFAWLPASAFAPIYGSPHASCRLKAAATEA